MATALPMGRRQALEKPIQTCSKMPSCESDKENLNDSSKIVNITSIRLPFEYYSKPINKSRKQTHFQLREFEASEQTHMHARPPPRNVILYILVKAAKAK